MAISGIPMYQPRLPINNAGQQIVQLNEPGSGAGGLARLVSQSLGAYTAGKERKAARDLQNREMTMRETAQADQSALAKARQKLDENTLVLRKRQLDQQAAESKADRELRKTLASEDRELRKTLASGDRELRETLASEDREFRASEGQKDRDVTERSSERAYQDRRQARKDARKQAKKGYELDLDKFQAMKDRATKENNMDAIGVLGLASEVGLKLGLMEDGPEKDSLKKSFDQALKYTSTILNMKEEGGSKPKATGKMVKMQSPKDGKVYEFDEAQASQAKINGWKEIQ